MENIENIKDDQKTTTATAEVPEKSKQKSYHPIEVRPMPRPKIKAFRASGLDPAINPEAETNPAIVIKTIDYIIDEIYGDLAEIENLEFYQLRDLATDTYIRANRGPESIKN
ncbi:MAG TPA: hypothetical protein DC017_05205 [Candidatus Wallbacteria bacterium]|nr:hypothetical protein [Candidatus Wallbacteria bacterium]